MSEESNQKACRVCCESIAEKASKCHHCGASQTWRRYLPSITIFISLLLGCMSVFSTFYPVARGMMDKKLDVAAETIGINAKAYTIWLKNDGKEPAAIKYINLFYGEEIAVLKVKDGTTVLPAKSSQILELVFEDDFVRPEEGVSFRRNEFMEDGGMEVIQRCEVMISIMGDNQEVWLDLKNDHCHDVADFILGRQSVG